MEITDYTEKSILLKGDTKPHKEKIKELGGKYNPTLGGWIFSKKKKEEVQTWIVSLGNKIDINQIEIKNQNNIEIKNQNNIEINQSQTNLSINQENIINVINTMYKKMSHIERLRFVVMISNLACTCPIE